ncbi:glutaminase A [Peredibacter starrii]|uniref:Glutaminase n=1 Tax=Peredibacter starrii TaxID=28202 RepID=A0AAX4HUB2_9BACT|nr:glutaminase A [Peredibacter starrii]WPU66806.1 glutaminase A [Peredibacter starrii]
MKILEELYHRHLSCTEGHPATYIPELAKANVKNFAIVIATVDGEIFKVGDHDVEFSMQSTSKPFSYGMVLQEMGRDFVMSKVGVEPTGEAFNSIVELEKNTHKPYNPMINSGAIAISSYIKGQSFEGRVQSMTKAFSQFAGHDLRIDDVIFESEKTTAHRNRSIAHLLRHFGVIDGKIEESLDLYFKQCSFMVNTVDLAVMASTLANKGIHPKTKVRALSEDYTGDVLSLMFTCGMYDTSGKWAYSVGIPAKSGVSGAIFGVIPGKMGIAVYSPPINEHGHSVRGMRVFQDLSKELNLSIFRK